jgi:tetratricopeptide (TPR) repeat protein
MIFLKKLLIAALILSGFPSLAQKFLWQKTDWRINTVQYEIVISGLTEFINKDSNNPKLYYQRGAYYVITNKFQNALEDFNKTLLLHKNFDSAFVSRSFCHIYLKDPEAAIKDCNAAIALNPKFSNAYNYRGLAKMSEKKYKEAMPDLDKAIQLDKENMEAYTNRVLCQSSMENHTKAIELLNEMIILSPEDSDPYFLRAVEYEYLGDGTKALIEFNKGLEKFPDHIDGLLGRCRLKDKMGDETGAVMDAEKAIQLNSRIPQSYYAAASAYYDLKYFKDVYNYCDKAIKLDSTFFDAFIMRGDAADYLGNSDQAIKDYQTAIRLEPKQTASYLQLAITLATLKDYKGAEATTMAGLAVKPDDAKLLFNYSKFKFQQNQLNESIDILNKLIKLYPEEKAFFLQRALVKDSMKLHASACEDALIAAKGYVGEAVAYIDSCCPKQKEDKIYKFLLLKEKVAIAIQNGNYYGIIEYCDQLEPNFKDTAWIYHERGLARRKLKQYESSIGDFSNSIKLNPKHPGSYVGRSNSYYNLDQIEKAVEDLNTCIKLGIADAIVYKNKGTFEYHLNQKDQAIKDYSKAIEMKPDYLSAITERAALYEEMKEFEKACADYKLAESYGDGSAISKRIFLCK